MPADRAEIGAAGEAYVAGRLERSGWRIVERNWRTRGGELDIVAFDGETLVFVEVRVRSDRFVAAEETVGSVKLNRLFRAAQAYIGLHPDLCDCVWRVDFVAVTLSPDGTVRRYNHFVNLELD